METHTEILNYIFQNKEVLAKALGLPSVWIRAKEHVLIRKTNERADLVFQDKFDARRGLKDATCFVLELKKGQGDHELLGQVKKYMEVLNKLKVYGHWGHVRGLTAARNYTESGIRLLWEEKIKTFLIRENNVGIWLDEVKPKRKAAISV